MEIEHTSVSYWLLNTFFAAVLYKTLLNQPFRGSVKLRGLRKSGTPHDYCHSAQFRTMSTKIYDITIFEFLMREFLSILFFLYS